LKPVWVRPAEPGYAAARIAPRLGGLAWARGSVSTPHGLISVDVSAQGVAVESPIPFVLDVDGKPAQRLAAGPHVVAV
jgi:alpha-L-rhamnosidase